MQMTHTWTQKDSKKATQEGAAQDGQAGRLRGPARAALRRLLDEHGNGLNGPWGSRLHPTSLRQCARSVACRTQAARQRILPRQLVPSKDKILSLYDPTAR